MIMKKIVIVVVVLAAILLIAPYGIGKVAESRVNRGLDKLIEHAPYFKIAERKWSGGWFKSEQTVTFELNDDISEAFGKKLVEAMTKGEEAQADAAMDAEGTEMPADGMSEAPAEGEVAADAAPSEEAPAEEAPSEEAAPAAPPTRFTVRNEILHGPILGLSGFGLARVDTHLDLPAEARAEIRKVFGEKPAMEVSTRVGFFGGGTTTFKSEGRKITPEKDDVEVSYETFNLAVGMGRNGDTYDVDGKLPSVIAKKKTGETVFSLTSMTMDGEGKRVIGDLYDGDFAFRIKEMKINEAASGGDMVVQDVHYIVDTRTKDDFVSMAAQFGTGAIKSQQLSMVGVDLKEVHYNFSLRHLHAPTFEKIVGAWNQMYTSPAALADMEKTVFGPMKEHGAELLKHDPEFGIDRVGIVTPDGEIVVKGVIKLVGATVDDFSAAGPMGLIGKVDADITLTADLKAVNKLPNGAQAVDGAVQSGYAEKKGEQLVSHITFKQGNLLVNGKPQAIPGMGGPPPEAMEGEGAMDPGAMPPQE
jgi:uncharacterized protein YdgA (DUF945 family)